MLTTEGPKLSGVGLAVVATLKIIESPTAYALKVAKDAGGDKSDAEITGIEMVPKENPRVRIHLANKRTGARSCWSYGTEETCIEREMRSRANGAFCGLFGHTANPAYCT
jgi:hypothetical protein